MKETLFFWQEIKFTPTRSFHLITALCFLCQCAANISYEIWGFRVIYACKNPTLFRNEPRFGRDPQHHTGETVRTCSTMRMRIKCLNRTILGHKVPGIPNVLLVQNTAELRRVWNASYDWNGSKRSWNENRNSSIAVLVLVSICSSCSDPNGPGIL